MDHSLYSPTSDPALTKINVIRGLVVLSTELTILHINKPAADLAGRLRRRERSVMSAHALPRLWLELSEEVREAMAREEATRAGRAIHVKRTLTEDDRSIVLSGFGLVAGNEPHHSRIVLMTEEHCPEHLAPTDLLRHRFLFTHLRAARESDGKNRPDGSGQAG